LTELGFFDRLREDINLGEGGKVAEAALKEMAPVNEAAIFNLSGEFPRFMYILKKDLDKVRASGDNYQSVAHLVRFFNAVYNPLEGRLEAVPESVNFTVANIQSFCDTSMIDILQSSSHSQVRQTGGRGGGNLLPRYERGDNKY
jgi:hypothetical protein